MKNVQFKLTPIKLCLIVLTSAAMAWVVYAASAATGSIALTPDKSTVTQGTTFTVTVATNTDTPITITHARITYDSSKLAFRGADYNGSPFTSNSPEASDGSGYVLISRYKTGDPYPTGSNFVARLTFEALTSGGSTTLTVAPAPDSSLYSAVDYTNILSSGSSTTIALASPAVPPSTPTPPTANPVSPTKPNSSTSSSSSTPTQSSGSTPTPIDPAVVPGSTDSFYGTPEQTPLAPGASRVATKPSIIDRALKMVRNALPILLMIAVFGGALWFVMKKIHEHPFGFAGPATTSSGVGTVKSPIVSNGIVGKPTSTPVKPDPNDHTPRTFSGI